MMLEEQQLRWELGVKDTAAGTDVCPISNRNERVLSHPQNPYKPIPAHCTKQAGFLLMGLGTQAMLEPSHFPLVPK